MKLRHWLGIALFVLGTSLTMYMAFGQEVGAPANTTAAAPAAAQHSGGLIAVIFKSGPAGVMVWIALIVCSVISVALIIDSFITIQDAKIMPAGLVNEVRTAMEQGDLLKAVQFCDANPGPLSRILSAGFAQVEEGFEVIQDAIGVAADLETEKVLSRVTYLSVISNTTPMLGLIGTVQGMIFAFANLATKPPGAEQQAFLALNISHGLWATAVGLSTAVPATIFYFFFKNRAMNIILRMEALTLDLIKALRNVEIVEE
ncbi:MAG: MotA/TolQ/ExbB proton channel family protein [bacterium]